MARREPTSFETFQDGDVKLRHCIYQDASSFIHWLEVYEGANEKTGDPVGYTAIAMNGDYRATTGYWAGTMPKICHMQMRAIADHKEDIATPSGRGVSNSW